MPEENDVNAEKVKVISLLKIILLIGLTTLLVGVSYCRNSVYIDDLTFWKDVISKNYYSPRAHSGLGMEYSRIGKLEQSREQLIIAIQLNPNYVEAHVNLGLSYLETKNYDEARREFEFALQKR
jgi:Flp pilus assembly protein TadD